MVVYLIIIWLMDRYEREPFWLVSLNFMWGATGAIFFGIIGSVIMGFGLFGILQFFSQYSTDLDLGTLNNIAGAVVVAPVVEESTKGIFLLITALSRNFDGPVDGAVYGGAIGLGFGMTENFLYFWGMGNTLESLFFLIIIRTLFSAVLHCCTQATLGAAIGYAKFRGLLTKFTIVPLGLAAAMFLHFVWNLAVSFSSTALIGFVFLIFTALILFTIFQFGVYHDGKIILKELTDESSNGYIPREHLSYLPFTSRRYKIGWCPPGINQKEYVKTAIKLALRKHQLKNLSPSAQRVYLNDVAILRQKIYSMLYPGHA